MNRSHWEPRSPRTPITTTQRGVTVTYTVPRMTLKRGVR